MTTPGSTDQLTPLQQAFWSAAATATPEVIDRLAEMLRQDQQRRDEQQFNHALAAAQAELPVVTKRNETGDRRYRYAALDDVMHVCGPILAKHGLSVSFVDVAVTDGRLTGTLILGCGALTRKSQVAMPLPEMRANAAQVFGSALTYCRRYAICSALNITAGDDDDAQTLNTTHHQPQTNPNLPPQELEI